MNTKIYYKNFSGLQPADPLSLSYSKFASETRQTFDVQHWDSVCAVTLTLKQAIRPSDHAREFLDQLKANANFRSFMSRLNRAVFTNAAKRHCKRLKVIPSLEKDADGRYHYHAALEKPSRFKEEEFRALIARCWTDTRWGYRVIDVNFGADQGWIEYMLKPSQKSGLEAWTDCIDWNSFYNNP
jgi:hypothetical protein